MKDKRGIDWFADRVIPVDHTIQQTVTEKLIWEAVEAINSGTYPKPPVYSNFPEDD